MVDRWVILISKGECHMTTEAAKAAKARYDAKTAKFISIKLNRNTDQEIIEFLDRQENKQGVIKQALLDYMKKTGK